MFEVRTVFAVAQTKNSKHKFQFLHNIAPFKHNFSQLGLIDDHQPPPHLTGGRGWPLPLYPYTPQYTPIYPMDLQTHFQRWAMVGFTEAATLWALDGGDCADLAKFGGVAYFLGQLLLGQNLAVGIEFAMIPDSKLRF